MAENKSISSKSLKSVENKKDNNEEIKNNESNKDSPAKEESEQCNLQTPLMFSRCSSLGSLSGFEQHSVHDDHSSIVSDCSSRARDDESSMSNPNELSMTQKTKYLARDKVQPPEKMKLSEKVPFQYDTAFRKPHFLKHSVFEDDVAAFKDESSPNLLSTTASSLSSLTIDDDDYGDNASKNKAGLVKRKSNMNNVPKMQNTFPQDFERQDPIGHICEPLRTSKVVETKRLQNNQYNKYSMHLVNKETDMTNKYSYGMSYEEQLREEQRKRMYYTENSMKPTWNSTSNQYSRNMQYDRTETDSSREEPYYRNDIRNKQTDKFSNGYQGKQMYLNHHKTETNYCNKFNNQDNVYESRYKTEEEYFEQNRYSQNSFRSNGEVNYINYNNDNNDLNAYEEQLLDQCIRRGMAKVTKRNISEIKPFCWDLNQICLTTRAMVKTHNEDIIRERQREYNKQHMSQRGSSKRLSNSRTK